MLRLLALVGYIFIVGKAELVPGQGALAGYCNHSDECEPEECCVSFIQPRGKRTIVTSDLPPELFKLVKGKCHNHAVKNETCFLPGGLMPSTPGLWYDCPCADDFFCLGSGINLFDKGEWGRCTPKKATRGLRQRCSSGADCSEFECCVSNFQPGGKRQSLQQPGHCEPLGYQGSYCYTRTAAMSGKPKDIVFSCPCRDGLACHGAGQVDAQLGEMGKCT